MPTSKQQLQRVSQMIKNGQRKQAVRVLAELIERDSQNPALWWLLANAAEDPAQARMALEELLSLRPNDPRATAMLNRLETRQLLSQMGIHRDGAARTRRPALLILGSIAAVFVAVIVGVLLLDTLNGNGTPDDNADATVAEQQPTLMVLPSETPGPATSQPPTETPAPSNDNNADAINPDLLLDPEATPELGVEANAPDADATPAPTEDLDTPAPLPLNPESTQEVNPAQDNPAAFNLQLTAAPQVDANPGALRGITSEGGGPTPMPTSVLPAPAVLDQRGQILEDTPRRELIVPYGEHAYTFSGYRSERVTLDLLNITGAGNPALELRTEDGYVIAADIDVISGDNTDAQVNMILPADGLYTVVVRMAAVDEQLYQLSLDRSGF